MEADEETINREIQEAQQYDLGPEADVEELAVLPCQWSGCESLFWEVEPLLTHVGAAHIDIQAHPNGKFSCEWLGCNRNGKATGTRSALQAHLRSHTGERPYICPRPECDKIFSRMDALQKHSQTLHDERLPTSRRPPTKKRKLDDATSLADESKRGDGEESADEAVPITEQPAAPMTETTIEVEQDDDAMAALIARHANQLPAFVRFIVTAAKHKYAVSEHASLVDELDLLQATEERMKREKDQLVERLVVSEVGPKAADLLKRPDPPFGGLQAWTLSTRTMLPAEHVAPTLGKYAEAAKVI